MKKIRSNQTEAKYSIPEMVTFGLDKFDLERRHAALAIGDKRQTVSKAEKTKYLEGLTTFRAEIEDGMDGKDWGTVHEKKVDALVKRWPKTSEAILNAVLKTYQLVRDECFDYAGGSEIDKIIMPEATKPEEIRHLFTLQSIFLSSETSYIGLSGNCTWDEEHGVGLVINGNRVIEVGGADVGFSPSAYDPKLQEPVEAVFSTDKKLYDLEWVGEFELTAKLPKPLREHIHQTIDYTEGRGLNGIHAVIIAYISNAEISGEIAYSMEAIESHYRKPIDLQQYFRNIRKHSNKEIKDLKRSIDSKVALPRGWDSFCMLNNGKLYAPP